MLTQVKLSNYVYQVKRNACQQHMAQYCSQLLTSTVFLEKMLSCDCDSNRNINFSYPAKYAFNHTVEQILQTINNNLASDEAIV